MAWEFDDASGTTTAHDAWCVDHADTGDPCSSAVVELRGFTSWAKRMTDGSLVAVADGQDIDDAALDAIAARVAELRRILAVDRFRIAEAARVAAV